jgi:hypothetical protein
MSQPATDYRCRCTRCGWVGYRKPAWRLDAAISTINGPSYRVHTKPCPRCGSGFVHGLSPKAERMTDWPTDPLFVAVNSARVCIGRFRVRPESTDLLSTALRELDDAIDLLLHDPPSMSR